MMGGKDSQLSELDRIVARTMHRVAQEPEILGAMIEKVKLNPRYQLMVSDPRVAGEALRSGEVTQEEFGLIQYIAASMDANMMAQERREERASRPWRERMLDVTTGVRPQRWDLPQSPREWIGFVIGW